MPKAHQKTKKKDKVVRHPRPYMITQQMAQIHALPNSPQKEELREKVIKQVVTLWTYNGMQLNNRTMTKEQLGTYLNISQLTIDKIMWRVMEKQGKVLGNKDAGSIARVLFSQALNWAIESRSRAADQVAILAGQQGQNYVPFLSSALNQSIANLNGSTAPILQLLRTLTDKQESTLLPYKPAPDHESDTINMNTEKAIAFLEDKGPSMLQDPIIANAQIAQYEAAGLVPDVNAKTQNAAEWMKPKSFANPQPDGPTKLPKSSATSTTGKVPKSLESDAKSHHENRREIEMGEVMDEEDFQA